jgi:hypothetical protein
VQELTHKQGRELDQAVAKELDYAIPHLEAAEVAAAADPAVAAALDVLLHLACWMRGLARVPVSGPGSSGPDSAGR